MKIFLQILWTLVWGFLGYALFLPVLSFTYGVGVYIYAVVYFAVLGFIALINEESGEKFVHFGLAVGTFLVMVLIGVFGTWGLINESSYKSLIGEITIEEFAANVAPISPEQMITVDQGIANRIGDKVLGEDPGLGSRCKLGDFYMQSVNGQLYWIAPLVHSGFFKWKGNNGTPGFVVVNATDERDHRLVTKTPDGKDINIRYQHEAFFGDYLERHLYTNGYSAVGLTDYTFEVNDSWEPYWTVTVYDTEVGFSGDEAKGVLVVDPATGKIEEYSVEDAPSWTDRIHPESFVREQVYYWGDYVNGYINWAGTGKLHPADGSTVVMGSNGHMYYYLGLQSSGADEGTTGFMMINCRTKEATWIQQAGATEEAARRSAQGAVQEKGYIGSEGITYNVGGHATYEFLLKDGAGLMKMIALVNVYDHNIYGVGVDRLSALRNYAIKMNSRGNASIGGVSNLEVLTVTGKISRFNSEVSNGNTLYYLMVEDQSRQFFGSSSVSSEFCLSKVGDLVTISFIEVEDHAEVEIRKFDNRSINLVKNPALEVTIARQDSVVQRVEDKKREVVLDKDWEKLSPEEKRELLRKK